MAAIRSAGAVVVGVLATVGPALGCESMNSVTASQLQCTYPNLGGSDASRYARLLSEKMGGSALSTTCQWAAFLGNVGTETDGLTEWTEIGCPYGPYCGRGPLQITGEANYRFCASQSMCDCSGIVSNPADAATPNIGVGTAACVWERLSGSSLSNYADGTLAGFRATACVINAGHTPCNDMNGWSSRQAYWEAATRCLGNGGGGGGGGGIVANDDYGGGGGGGGGIVANDDDDSQSVSSCRDCISYSGGTACSSRCGVCGSSCTDCVSYGGGRACLDRCCSSDGSYQAASTGSSKTKKKISASEEAGIIVGVAVFVAAVGIIALYMRGSKHDNVDVDFERPLELEQDLN